MDWMHNFFIPLIKALFLFGIGGYICFIIGKAISNAWSKSYKFFWKYKIMRKPYNETTLKWCLDCIDQGIGYYDAKKLMLVKATNEDKMWETLWIYDQIIEQMKGGITNNGRKFEEFSRKTQSTATAKELPNFQSEGAESNGFTALAGSSF